MATTTKELSVLEQVQIEVNKLDLLTASNKQINDVIAPLLADGKIIGIVDSCTATKGVNARNGDKNSFQVKVLFPTEGSRADVFGKTRQVVIGFWVETFEAIEPLTVVEFATNKMVVVLGEKVMPDGEIVIVKRLSLKAEMLTDKKELRQGFSFVVEPLNKTVAMTAIQGQKLFTLKREVVMDEE